MNIPELKEQYPQLFKCMNFLYDGYVPDQLKSDEYREELLEEMARVFDDAYLVDLKDYEKFLSNKSNDELNDFCNGEIQSDMPPDGLDDFMNTLFEALDA